MKSLITISAIITYSLIFSQTVPDSNEVKSPTKTVSPPTVPGRQITTMQNFAGSFNGLFYGEQMQGSFDLSVETYHYFLITSRRYKNDSVHAALIENKTPLMDVYKGFHMYLINRAALDFDTLRAIANNYLTSLIGSPLTARFSKDFFLTKARKITAQSFTPVLAIRITGDGRLIPYNDRAEQLHFGASSHFYLSFLANFRRLELNSDGKMIDNGTMYLKPVVGIAYGTKQLMTSLMPDKKPQPILTSGCRLGFRSDLNKVKDFSFFMNYTLTDIVGPKLRAGVLLGSNTLN